MRIHSDIIRPEDVRNALRTAQSEGRVSDHVHIDVLSAHGSRKRSGAVEVQLGSDTSESFISLEVETYAHNYGSPRKILNKIKRRYPRQGKSQMAGDHLASSATWHEYGHFIAELFAIDPHAIIGDYDQADSFYYQTYEQPMNYRTIDPMTSDYGDGRAYDFLGDIEDWEARTDNYNYWA